MFSSSLYILPNFCCILLKEIRGDPSLIMYFLFCQASEECVKEYFSKFGDICEIKLLRKPAGDLVGRGIIQFNKEKSAVKAIKSCNGKDFMGKKQNLYFIYIPNYEPLKKGLICNIKVCKLFHRDVRSKKMRS